MSTVVTGASDDLIELDGDIYEEFGLHNDEGGEDAGDLIAFSNGVVLRVRYSQSGVWRITPVTGADKVSIVQAPEDDDDNYTDRATITEPVLWAVQGITIARAKR